MIKGKPYQPPPAVFQPGETVYHIDNPCKLYTVRASDHCFCWVEGERCGIANWLLRRKSETKKQYLKRAFGWFSKNPSIILKVDFQGERSHQSSPYFLVIPKSGLEYHLPIKKRLIYQSLSNRSSGCIDEERGGDKIVTVYRALLFAYSTQVVQKKRSLQELNGNLPSKSLKWVCVHSA